MTFVVMILSLLTVFKLTNIISYSILKKRILLRRKWDLNICCGKTDGGGVNVDIVRHAELPNFVLIDDIYHLPFRDRQFEHVLCSHTIEHVEDPFGFYRELKRVGKHVTIVAPPLWDLTAAFNILEHRWIFLTLKKEFHSLPKLVRMPFATFLHRKTGQRIHA